MQLLLDSNFHATLRFGSRQLQPIFSDIVQSRVQGAPERVSLVSQIGYFMRTLPPPSKVALIFGSFENMLTGRRSPVQHFPIQAVRAEVALYVQMFRDLLRTYANVYVYVLAPLFRSQPLWYESVYGEMSNLFCSEVSHVDPDRVRVVPLWMFLLKIWTLLACILAMPLTSSRLTSFYRHLWMAFLSTQIFTLLWTPLVTFYTPQA
jgi:hypothetical protein